MTRQSVALNGLANEKGRREADVITNERIHP